MSTVNHPAHYNAHKSGIECITVVRQLSFNLGNAVKYLWRAGEKGKAAEDIAKAVWYLRDEATRLESFKDFADYQRAAFVPEIPEISAVLLAGGDHRGHLGTIFGLVDWMAAGPSGRADEQALVAQAFRETADRIEKGAAE